MMQSYNSSCYREHQDWEEITCDDCQEEEAEHVWRPVHVCVRVGVGVCACVLGVCCVCNIYTVCDKMLYTKKS